MRRRLIGVALLISAAASAHADGVQVAKCRARPQHASCRLVFAKTARISVFAEPSATAARTAVLERAQPVQIDWVVTLTGPRAWVHVTTIGHPGPRNASPNGWIRSVDLVGDADFRRIQACWPFKSLVDSEVIDGTPLDIQFTPHGDGVDGIVHVWRAGEVLRIGPSLSAATPYAYDESGRTLFDPVMHRFPEVTAFDGPVMRDCQPPAGGHR